MCLEYALHTCRHGFVIVTVIVAVTTAGLAFLFSLRHRRGFSDRSLDTCDQVAQYRIAEPECAGELGEGLLIDLDVEQHVVCFVDLGDWVGELAAAPVLDPMHGAVAGRNHAAIALEHGRNLLALVRMHQKYDLVMPHSYPPYG